MNKKALMPILTLLVLFSVAPVIATPAAKIEYTADVNLVIDDPGKALTKGGTLHVKGVTANGSFETTSGPPISGIMWKEFDFTVNSNTGKGTIHGKFVLTVVGVGTLEGSFRGIITEGAHLAGTVVGHGTAGFEGLKTMGTWEGDILDGGIIENGLEAIILSPKGPL